MIKDRSEPLNYREHKQNLANTLKTLISIALIFLFSENPSVKKKLQNYNKKGRPNRYSCNDCKNIPKKFKGFFKSLNIFTLDQIITF